MLSPPLRLLIGRGLVNHPGLAEMVLLSDLDRPIKLGLHHTADPSGRIGIDAEFIREQSTSTPDSYVDEVLRAALTFRAELLWPGRELDSFAERIGEFEALGVRVMTCCSAPVLKILEDKLEFGRAVERLGIPSPLAIPFDDLVSFDAAYGLIAEAGERVCFKPRRGIYGRGFRVVREGLDLFEELFEDPGYRLDLEDARRRLGSRTRFRPMLAMPWLSGPEWSVDCFRSKDGAHFTAVPRRKVGADLQEVEPRVDLIELSRRLGDGFGLRGLFNCQFRFHRERAHVLEINARPAGGVGLTALAGARLPEQALRDALDLPQKTDALVRPMRAWATRTWQVLSEAGSPLLAPRPFGGLSGQGQPADDGICSSTEDIVAQLPSGRIRVSKVGGSWGAKHLFGVAARRGARRPFLLVSKVLGKHWPVSPERMAAAHRALAEQLTTEFPGPVTFVGMGETATGLGWGVYEVWRELTRRNDALYLHSTRYVVPGTRTIPFEESHSHAPEQAILEPLDPELRSRFLASRSVVVVDDELTTGRTAAMLVRALQASGVPVGSTAAVSLVSALPDSAVLAGGPLAGWVHVSLCRVAIEMETLAAKEPSPPLDQSLVRLEPGVGLRRWGRLAAEVAPSVPSAIVDWTIAAMRGRRIVFVVGAGECLHPAFLLGRALEARGHVVLLQSTTRSPIEVGGAVATSMPCEDCLGSNVPFYLHNPPAAGEGVVVLHEPGGGRAALTLAKRFGGVALEVWDA